MRKVYAFLCLIAFISIVGHGWYRVKDGFNVNRLRFPIPEGEVENVAARLPLQEPYQYLGRGRQCYVFASLDGKTVMKLPRFDRYFLPFRWKVIPFFNSLKRSDLDDRQSRLAFTLESFKLAYSDLRNETGVLHLHLHRTKNLPKQFTIIDRIGRSYQLDLNKTVFILQERKPLMMPIFRQALREKDRKKAQEVLDAFLEVVSIRSKRGIFNKDPSFLRNFGMEAGRGIQIDIGSFYRKKEVPPEKLYELCLRDGMQPLREWLSREDADMLHYIDARIEEMLKL